LETTPATTEPKQYTVEELQQQITLRDNIIIEVGMLLMDLGEAANIKGIMEKFKDKNGNPREPNMMEVAQLVPSLMGSLPAIFSALDKEKLGPLMDVIIKLYGTEIKEKQGQRKIQKAMLAVGK
jgi:hypothetical protein